MLVENDTTVLLAERMRPRTLDECIGQLHIIGPHGLLRRFCLTRVIPLLIFYGPSGVGKTTVASLVAREGQYAYTAMDATDTTLDDLKLLCSTILRSNHNNNKTRHVIFIDEMHRFSKVQQDFLLSYVEQGRFTLIGATTVRARIRTALLSRCHIFQFERLTHAELRLVAARAMEKLNETRPGPLLLSTQCLDLVADYASGDARRAINLIELLGSQESVDYSLIHKVCAATGLKRDPREDDFPLFNELASILHGDGIYCDDNALLGVHQECLANRIGKAKAIIKQLYARGLDMQCTLKRILSDYLNHADSVDLIHLMPMIQQCEIHGEPLVIDAITLLMRTSQGGNQVAKRLEHAKSYISQPGPVEPFTVLKDKSV